MSDRIETPFGTPPCVLLSSGIVARTAITYRSFAEGYPQMEEAHAGETFYLHVTGLGIGTVSIGAFDDLCISKRLQLAPGENLLCPMPFGRPKGMQRA